MSDLLHQFRNETHEPRHAWERLTDEERQRALALHGKQPIPNAGLYDAETFEQKLLTWSDCVRAVDSGAAFFAIAVHGRPESDTA
jgi:hypothetical protein